MYNLFIDESGKHSLKSVDVWAPHFSLAGIIIHDDIKQVIKIKADRIKFKYWNETNVVFHASEIRRQSGKFSVFKHAGAKFSLGDFYTDFTDHFLNQNYKIGLVTINKLNYLKNNPPIAHAVSQLSTSKPGSGWEKQVSGASNKLLKRAATELFTMYLDYLIKKDSYGEVIMESSNDIQDILIYSAYNELLTRGFAPLGLGSIDVRKRFTGISFVTKLNHDIESQLADIAAHYLNLESKITDSVITTYPKPHDENIVNFLKSKFFYYHKTTSSRTDISFIKMY